MVSTEMNDVNCYFRFLSDAHLHWSFFDSLEGAIVYDCSFHWSAKPLVDAFFGGSRLEVTLILRRLLVLTLSILFLSIFWRLF